MEGRLEAPPPHHPPRGPEGLPLRPARLGPTMRKCGSRRLNGRIEAFGKHLVNVISETGYMLAWVHGCYGLSHQVFAVARLV